MGAVGVLGAIGASAVDFERLPVVVVAGDRAADHRYPDQFAVAFFDDTDHELGAAGRLVVPVVAGDVVACLLERDGDDLKFHSRSMRGMPPRSSPVCSLFHLSCSALLDGIPADAPDDVARPVCFDESFVFGVEAVAVFARCRAPFQEFGGFAFEGGAGVDEGDVGGLSHSGLGSRGR